MSDPLKAAVFVCRAHGVNLMAMRSLLKDPRVGHSEILPSCCAPAGMDQVQLHLRGMTTQALLIIGCQKGKEESYRRMARTAGLPAHRVALVPAEACRTVNASELALARVLDDRVPVLSAEPRYPGLLIVGEGSSAEAALEQAEAEGIAFQQISTKDLLEPGARLLGGPGRFVLEAGESIYEFGAAMLVMDQEVVAVRDVLGDGPGTVLASTGGAECLDVLSKEADRALSKGDAYVVMQETPFTGLHELEYRGLQSRGVIFLRSPEVKVTAKGVSVRDEHLGKELLLSVGELITISSSRPEGADRALSMFGLPYGWRSTDAITGEGGVPGVYLGGSALTVSVGAGAERAVRAHIIKLAGLRTVQDSAPLAKVDGERCSLCLTCYRLCPYHAPFIEGEAMAISIERCRGCGLCLSMCPSHAIEIPFADLRSEMGGTKMGPGGR